MQNNPDLSKLLERIDERLEELEKPKQWSISDVIPLASLLITLIAGFTSTVFISVSKITTLEIRNQYLTENVLELKREVTEIKNRLTDYNDTKRQTNNKPM
ncbi:hypothetical protein [Nostoc phage A1]|nr:hypothetical protein [Nostoc phage A1]